MNPIDSHQPSIAVVSEIARKEGSDPAELQPPLWSAIDPEALDQLFEDGDAPAAVTFRYRGYTVRVDRTGTVRLEDERAQIASE
jgi:hypothetical protein